MKEVEKLPVYLRRVAERFDEDADRIVGELVGRIDAEPTPARIYHYTSADGLTGILTNGVLWCSDIFTLNDPSEVTYSLRHAVALLQSKAATKDEKLLAQQLEEFASDAAAQAIAHFFVCSFGIASDDLNQWRAYGDNGRGFVLGFATQPFERAFTKPNGVPVENNSTFPVSYNDDELHRLIQLLMDQFCKKAAFVRRAMPSHAEAFSAYMCEILLTLVLHLYRLSLFYKHPAYRAECEYRFLELFRGDQAAPAVETRQRGERSIRFRRFDWKSIDPAALVSIGVGPAMEWAEGYQTAVQLLEKAGLKGVEIYASRVPYRN